VSSASLIGGVLPAAAVAVEVFGDPETPPLLAPEQEYVVRAAESRRREFTTTRHCARTALAGLGIPPVPIPRDGRNAPRWPSGTVGSMTHCAGYRAAAVAPAAEMASLGIDAEPHAVLPRGVLDVVARPEELSALGRLPGAGATHWDRVLFSVKESVYKAWYPLAGSWLDFHDVSVTFDAEASGFAARVLPAAAVVDALRGPERAGAHRALAPATVVQGRFRVVDGLVLSAAVIPPARSAGSRRSDAGTGSADRPGR
jgi:4'-phosphopantetheinyl transferase EntD